MKVNIAPMSVEELEQLRKLLMLLQMDPLIPASKRKTAQAHIGTALAIVSHCLHHPEKR